MKKKINGIEVVLNGSETNIFHLSNLIYIRKDISKKY